MIVKNSKNQNPHKLPQKQTEKSSDIQISKPRRPITAKTQAYKRTLINLRYLVYLILKTELKI